MRHEILYLNDIVEAADHIAQFIAGVDSQAFQGSELLRSAVAQKLSIIGEAAAHLPEDLTTRHPEVPWPQIVAFRNILCTHISESIGTWFGAQLRTGVRCCAPRSPTSLRRNPAARRAKKGLEDPRGAAPYSTPQKQKTPEAPFGRHRGPPLSCSVCRRTRRSAGGRGPPRILHRRYGMPCSSRPARWCWRARGMPSRCRRGSPGTRRRSEEWSW